MRLEIKDKAIEKYFDKFGIKSTKIRKAYAFFETLSLRMSEHNLFLSSAGIAFNILIYTIPLLLVIVFVISSFFNVDDIINFLVTILNNIMPPGKQSSKLIEMVLNETTSIFKNSGTAGIIGIVTMIWLSSVLLGALRSGLNEIFRLPYNKTFILYKLKDILITIMILLLVLISIYILPFSTFVLEALMEYIPDVIQTYLSNFIIFLITLGSSFLTFYLLFRFVPNSKIKLSIRLWATILSVGFIEISRNIFSWYISISSSYSKFYGTFAIIVSMSIWIYYLTTIILISAELSQLIFDVKHSEEPVALQPTEEK